jgi:hypothetical protein
MRDFRDAKTMAKALRHSLASQGLEVSHSQSLELVAQAFGVQNWNILAAQIAGAAAKHAPAKRAPSARSEDEPMRCSFCGKSQHEVKKLIAAPGSSICNECVARCDDVLEDSELNGLVRRDAEGLDGAAEALAAYLGARTDEQLAAYLARSEQAAQHERALIAGLDGDRADLSQRYRDLSPKDQMRQRSQIAERLRSTDVVKSLVATRNAHASPTR